MATTLTVWQCACRVFHCRQGSHGSTVTADAERESNHDELKAKAAAGALAGKENYHEMHTAHLSCVPTHDVSGRQLYRS